MFTLPDLPFAFDALEPHIDTQTMQVHHDKHHAAYVANLSDALPDKSDSDLLNILTHLEDFPEDIRIKVRNNAGGHFNHSFFWSILSPRSTSPDGKLLDLIHSTFGSLDTFKEKFSAVAMGRFGSGWAWLIADKGQLSIMNTPNQDSPVIDDKTPILGLDVWEHAYYLKYQNRRSEYIAAWWNVVNWSEVSSRLERVQV